MAMMKEELTTLMDLRIAMDDTPCYTPEEICAYAKAADTFWKTLITVSKTHGCSPFELLSQVDSMIEELDY